MTTVCAEPAVQQDFAEEKAELEAVIASSLRPNSNMAQLLRYVCEKRFSGLAEEIKEYNIAVEALHRPASFDPSRDSIVRVEAHRLRNRLDRLYQQDGTTHRVRIIIPAGTYVPQFEYFNSLPQADAQPSMVGPAEEIRALSPVAVSQRPLSFQVSGTAKWIWPLTAALFVALAALLVYMHERSAPARTEAFATPAESVTPTASPQPTGLRILAGVKAPAFTDALGTSWSGDRYFAGGSAESVSPRAISFAQDPSIFLHRRRGAFSYTIPLSPGSHELRLYFADAFFGENNPDGGGEASRVFDVKANGRTLLHNFDVISDAGGSNTADVKIFEAIEPDSSGRLRIDFIPKRDVAFVNAIEILPTPQGRAIPIRIAMEKNGYTDADGTWWEPDHFYRGGVSFSTSPSTSRQEVMKSRIEGERFGNFVYAVPVAPGRVYEATLTFKEVDMSHLLGDTPRERIDIFSVFANGRPLAENLQIYASNRGSPAVRRTFRNLTPNAQDKLIFDFVPIQNYAVVNALEVIEDR